MNNEYLRHTVATIAYRFNKSISKAKETIGDFRPGKDSRSTSEIINHMYYVLSFTTSIVSEEKGLNEPPEKLGYNLEIERFNKELQTLSKVLLEKELAIKYSKKLLQGPLSDILTHIGQISMMSRLHGYPIEKEDFSSADIEAD